MPKDTKVGFMPSMNKELKEKARARKKTATRKKVPAKKVPAKKAPAKKAPATKAPAKKATARKARAKKVPAKTTAARRSMPDPFAPTSPVASAKVTRVGNSAGLLLSKDVLQRLGVKIGEQLFLVQAGDGSFRLTPYDPDFERQMRIAEEGMRDYRNALRELAK